jgi:hypothetical protein
VADLRFGTHDRFDIGERKRQSGESAGQNRHVRRVTDLAGGFGRPWRVGVPESGADGQRQKRNNGCNQEPTVKTLEL